jgi:hypothetical protein
MPLDKRKLALLIPMLGSNSDGEVANAARLIRKVLAEAKMDWHDLAKLIVGNITITELAAQDATPRAGTGTAGGSGGSYQSSTYQSSKAKAKAKSYDPDEDWPPPFCFVVQILESAATLHMSEKIFLNSLRERWIESGHPFLTPKQHKWLMDIAERVGVT